MKKGAKFIVLSLTVIMVLSLASTAMAADIDGGDGGLYIDGSDTVYVYQGGEYVEAGYQPMSSGSASGQIQTRASDFGESNASWRYSKTDNGYTVNHKGWKERKSMSDIYGVKACSATGCSPSKRHWTQARMTYLATGLTAKDSGQIYGTGTVRATSPVHDVYYTQSSMRSTWGGVGTVISQW